MFSQELDNLEKQIEILQNQRRTLLQKEAKIESLINYSFTDKKGDIHSISALFHEKEYLLVVHNMGVGCTYCTLWADGFNGIADHLDDAFSFVVATPDSFEVMKSFADARLWKFQMISAKNTTFFEDMGFATKKDEKTYYMPGYSLFQKNNDGSISRIAMDYFGPGDSYSSIWHMLSFLPKEFQWSPKKSYQQK
jgi:predicted dithiol-disulfide oxidoreductase (DUF899 family)